MKRGLQEDLDEIKRLAEACKKDSITGKLSLRVVRESADQFQYRSLQLGLAGGTFKT